MSIMYEQNPAAFLAKDALSLMDELQRQIMRGAWMSRKKSGVQWMMPFPRLLLLLAMTTIGGCAQIELYRLQGEVDELQAQLAYEKQRLKLATEQADTIADQPVGQRKTAKACKRRTKAGADSRPANCLSGKKVVK